MTPPNPTMSSISDWTTTHPGKYLLQHAVLAGITAKLRECDDQFETFLLQISLSLFDAFRVICYEPFISLERQYCSNKIDVNCGPLSVTSCSGRPCDPNTTLKASIVASAEVLLILTISGHFVFTSTFISHYPP